MSGSKMQGLPKTSLTHFCPSPPKHTRSRSATNISKTGRNSSNGRKLLVKSHSSPHCVGSVHETKSKESVKVCLPKQLNRDSMIANDIPKKSSFRADIGPKDQKLLHKPYVDVSGTRLVTDKPSCFRRLGKRETKTPISLRMLAVSEKMLEGDAGREEVEHVEVDAELGSKSTGIRHYDIKPSTQRIHSNRPSNRHAVYHISHGIEASRGLQTVTETSDNGTPVLPEENYTCQSSPWRRYDNGSVGYVATESPILFTEEETSEVTEKREIDNVKKEMITKWIMDVRLKTASKY